jgi:hypothetical protein
LLTGLKIHCIFAVLVLFVFHNWAHPKDRPVEGGFFFRQVFQNRMIDVASIRLRPFDKSHTHNNTNWNDAGTILFLIVIQFDNRFLLH